MKHNKNKKRMKRNFKEKILKVSLTTTQIVLLVRNYTIPSLSLSPVSACPSISPSLHYPSSHALLSLSLPLPSSPHYLSLFILHLSLSVPSSPPFLSLFLLTSLPYPLSSLSPLYVSPFFSHFFTPPFISCPLLVDSDS